MPVYSSQCIYFIGMPLYIYRISIVYLSDRVPRAFDLLWSAVNLTESAAHQAQARSDTDKNAFLCASLATIDRCTDTRKSWTFQSVRNSDDGRFSLWARKHGRKRARPARLICRRRVRYFGVALLLHDTLTFAATAASPVPCAPWACASTYAPGCWSQVL